jgi:hypothetical protein
MDVDSIALGRDFRQVLQENLASCDLLVALIGREWVDAKNQSGRRRLEDPDDFVRLEIAAALKRNIPVTPVLLQGAQMPTAEQLPEELRDLSYRNGFELSYNRWESDVQEMIKRLGLKKLGVDAPSGFGGPITERREKTFFEKLIRVLVPRWWWVLTIAIASVLLYYINFLLKPTKTVQPPDHPTTESPTAPPRTNLIPNPSFEMVCEGAPCNWINYNPGYTTIAANTNSHSGLYSLAITTSNSSPGAKSPCITGLTGGMTFDVTYWYNTADRSVTKVGLDISFLSTNCRGLVGNNMVSPSSTLADGQWHQVKGTVAAPAGTRSALFHLFQSISSPVSSSSPMTLFDDVSFSGQ